MDCGALPQIDHSVLSLERVSTVGNAVSVDVQQAQAGAVFTKSAGNGPTDPLRGGEPIRAAANGMGV